jgi:hypothetical protein
MTGVSMEGCDVWKPLLLSPAGTAAVVIKTTTASNPAIEYKDLLCIFISSSKLETDLP